MSTPVAQTIGQIIDDRNALRNIGEGWGVSLPTDNLTQTVAKFSEIINRGAVQAQVKEGETFTIPAGMHNGSGTVSGMGSGGNYTLQQRTVTPSKSEQDITPDEGYFGLSSVTVNPIPSQFQDVSGTTVIAAQVLAGALFVTPQGVTTPGTMTNHGAISGSIDGMTENSYTIPEGYHNGAGTVILTDDIAQALALI